MKVGVLLGVLCISVLFAGGCGSNSKQALSRDDSVSLTDAPDRTLYEIDIASRLRFDADRQKAFKAIASRPGLSETVQMHLIQAVFDHLAFESAKQDVLLTIIRNPDFNSKVRRAILGKIDTLVFENDREKILRAIDSKSI